MVGDEVIRVCVAEDDYLVREGTRAVLEGVTGITLVDAVASPGEFLDVLDEQPVDVALLDIRMPPTFTTEGIDLAGRLRDQHPEIGIVMVSQHADPEYAIELLGDGSERVAYLLKERLADVGQLEQAIRGVADGRSVLDPKIVDALLAGRSQQADSPLDELTPRETEVLTHMAAGKTNAAIANRLHLSERSVEKHTSSIFTKLDLEPTSEINRRVAAVAVYLQRRSG